MRINELIVESQQIDELSLAGALGSAAKGAANIVGGAKGAWAGAKDVYNQQAGRVANVAQRNVQRAGGYKAPAKGVAAPVGTSATPAATSTTQPEVQPTGTAPAATGTPQPTTATPAQQPITVRQINQAIPTLRKRDLTSVKNTVDATVAKKMPAAATAQPAPAENPNIVQGTNENFKSKFLGIDL